MRRFLPILVSAALLVSLSASASVLCTPGTAGELVGDDLIISHPNIHGGAQVYAGTFNAYVDCLTPTLVYCVASYLDVCHSTQYVQGPDIESSEVVWILNNYYPAVPGMPSELSTDQERKAAVQLALWHFADGLDISEGGSNPVVFDAARAIIVAAETAVVPPTPSSLVLTPPYVAPWPYGAVTVTATLRDQNGNVMPNVPISWTINAPPPGSSGSGVTDENGQFAVDWSWGGTGVLTFTVDYTIPIGLRWTSPGCQDLMQAATVPGRVTAIWGEDVPSGMAPTTWGTIKSLYR